MKKILGILVLGLLWCNVGLAETKSWIEKKNNETPIHEIVRVYSLCYSYFKMGEEVKIEEEQIKYSKLAKLTKRSLEELTNKSKITNKKMIDYAEQVKKKLYEDIDNDLSNFSILEYTYNDFCRNIALNQQETIEYFQNKYE